MKKNNLKEFFLKKNLYIQDIRRNRIEKDTFVLEEPLLTLCDFGVVGIGIYRGDSMMSWVKFQRLVGNGELGV